MSIAAAVQELVEKGKLIDRPSAFLGLRARRIYVTPEIDGISQLPFADTLEGERYAELANYLDAFCEMNEISVAENPEKKPRDVMLARVKPIEDDFWSMRVTDPEETAGIRLLGAFCEKDEFVALSRHFREDMEPFKDDVEELREIWRDHFGDLIPHTGSCLDDYLSNYISY